MNTTTAAPTVRRIRGPVPAAVTTALHLRRGAIRGLMDGRLGRPEIPLCEIYPGDGRRADWTADLRQGYAVGFAFGRAEAGHGAPDDRAETLAWCIRAARRLGIPLRAIVAGVYSGRDPADDGAPAEAADGAPRRARAPGPPVAGIADPAALERDAAQAVDAALAACGAD